MELDRDRHLKLFRRLRVIGLDWSFSLVYGLGFLKASFSVYYSSLVAFPYHWLLNQSLYLIEAHR
jgi:hypothetical protein